MNLHKQQKKIYLCGTVHGEKKHDKVSSKDKNMQCGECPMSSNGITGVKWMDNRSVMLLSNFVNSTEMTSLSRARENPELQKRFKFLVL